MKGHILKDVWTLKTKEQQYENTCLVFVYKYLKGLSPQYIQDSLVVKRPPEQAVRTRSAQVTYFLVSKFRKCAGERAFFIGCSTSVEQSTYVDTKWFILAVI